MVLFVLAWLCLAFLTFACLCLLPLLALASLGLASLRFAFACFPSFPFACLRLPLLAFISLCLASLCLPWLRNIIFTFHHSYCIRFASIHFASVHSDAPVSTLLPWYDMIYSHLLYSLLSTLLLYMIYTFPCNIRIHFCFYPPSLIFASIRFSSLLIASFHFASLRLASHFSSLCFTSLLLRFALLHSHFTLPRHLI